MVLHFRAVYSRLNRDQNNLHANATLFRIIHVTIHAKSRVEQRHKRFVRTIVRRARLLRYNYRNLSHAPDFAGGSRDKTRRIVSAMARHFPREITRKIRNNESWTNRNYRLQQLRSDLFFFCQELLMLKIIILSLRKSDLD